MTNKWNSESYMKKKIQWKVFLKNLMKRTLISDIIHKNTENISEMTVGRRI
jgi:hypothetical protein